MKLFEVIRELGRTLELIQSKLATQEKRINDYGSLIMGISQDHLEYFLTMTDGEKEFSITVDNRTSKPLIKEDAIKIITVFSDGKTKIKFTHKDNLTEQEKEQVSKRGFLVV